MSLEITDFFDLRIGPGEAPGPYRVEVVSSSTKPAVTNMELPQGLDESLAAVRMHAPDLGAFQELGSKLYHALFSGDVGRAWNESQDSNPGRQEGGLRLCLRVDDPDLERLPWELLYDGRSFLTTNPDRPFSRYLPSGSEPLAFDNEGKLRVLAVLESPAGLPPIMPEFRQAFESSLRDLNAMGVESKVLDNASLDNIFSALQDGYHVLHLVAHGDDSGQIALVGDDHTTMRRINDREFAQLFQGRRVRLVVLSACGSAGGAGGDLFSGVGPSLIRSRVSAVITTQYPFVHGSSAGIFAKAFYESLAIGLPVDVAVSKARRMLSSGGNLDQRDWSAPILYLANPYADVVSPGKVGADQGTRSAAPPEPRSTHPSADRGQVIPQEALPLAEKICEEFQGFVEKIEDDKAYVRLDTSCGERLCGPYPAEELASKGIGERDRFLLRAVKVGGAIRFDAELIPRKIITPERQRQIREEIEAGLEGFTPDDER